MNIREAINHLLDLAETDGLEKAIYADIWQVEDIHAAAEGINVDLTDEQVIQVIDAMHNCHDATIGINWDVIQDHITWVLKDGQ